MDKESENKVVSLRDEKNRFVKGSVGNPTGTQGALRDRATIEKLTVEQMYRAHAVEVFESLLKLIRSKDIAPTARIAAIKEYNSRALGNPSTTTILKNGSRDAEEIDLSDMTDDVLRQVVDRANKH